MVSLTFLPLLFSLGAMVLHVLTAVVGGLHLMTGRRELGRPLLFMGVIGIFGQGVPCLGLGGMAILVGQTALEGRLTLLGLGLLLLLIAVAAGIAWVVQLGRALDEAIRYLPAAEG